MYLLNFILISFVALTQSATLPKVPFDLSMESQKHPNFQKTLLNKTVVPFLAECETSVSTRPQTKSKFLCGPYIEMVAKLDDSKIDALNNKPDLDDAMNAYNNMTDDFCTTFLNHIPKDKQLYPYSYTLSKFVEDKKRCNTICLDIDLTTYNFTVVPFCRLIDSGFKSSVPQSVPAGTNTMVIKDLGNKTDHSGTDTSKTDISNHALEHQLHKNKSVDSPSGPPNSIPETAPENTGERNNEITAKAENKELKPNAPIKEDVQPTPTNIAEPKIDTNVPGPKESHGEEKNENEQVLDITKIKTTTTESEDSDDILEPNNDGDDSRIDPNSVKDDNIVDNNEEADIDDEDGDDGGAQNMNKKTPEQSPPKKQLDEQSKSPSKEEFVGSKEEFVGPNEEYPFEDVTDSNFFTYFMFLIFVCVIAYVVYHNKTKMLALMLEGRRSSTSGRSGLSRRKHTAAYRKLDSNLEEAITSSANGRSTQVIY